MSDVESQVSEIEELEVPELTQIPFSLLERQNNRTTKLLANSGATQPIEGRSIPFRYTFKEPVFLSHIVVQVTGYASYDRFVIEATSPNGETNQISAQPKDGQVYADIDQLCDAISFEPPRAWLRSPTLQSVELHGFKQSETAQFIRFAHDVDDLKAQAIEEIRDEQGQAQTVIDQAAEAQASLDGINSQINDAKAALEATQAQSASATNKLNELVAKVGATSKQLEATEERLSNLHSDIKVETQRKEQLQNEIVADQAKLKELESNINLFPSEITGFVDQAGANNKLYLQYAIGPIFILSAMFILLISGAVDLTTVITEKPNVNLAAIAVSRTPYVAVATAIIYASYRLAKLFIMEVMNNNRQRLSLTKISIIAKDISQAAETGLTLSDQQVYANRMKAKMALLSEHIRHLTTTEPELLFPENLFSPLGPEDDADEKRALPTRSRKKQSKPKSVASGTPTE